MGFRKTRPGQMGILTIPQGTRLYRAKNHGDTFERARKEFDVLALPSHRGPHDCGHETYSFKMRDEFWFVLKEDIPEDQ